MRYIVRLYFRSPLHIGEDHPGVGIEGSSSIIHSDTIFSAIANHWAVLPCNNGNLPLERLLERFEKEEPPFLISSAFYYKSTSRGTTYYLPKPLTDNPQLMELKNVRYLELADFTTLARGDWFKGELPKDPEDEIVRPAYLPRVSLDRISSDSNLFHAGTITFRNGGLFFLMDIRDESLLPTIKLCLNLLGETGLGGERSTGCGLFEWSLLRIKDDPQWEPLWELEKEPDKRFCLISLCFPQKEEVKNIIGYNLILRKGWIYSTSTSLQLKRKTCQMLGEGSVFSEKPVGDMVDVTPGEFKKIHPVYRYGKAFALSMKY